MFQPALVVAFVAPSGSGKSTIINAVLKSKPQYQLVKSYTTRKPRHADDNEYYFLEEESFLRLREEDFFFETERIFGNLYGIPRNSLQGDKLIFNLDIHGFHKVKQLFPHLLSIFILPPSREELVRRLEQRGEREISVRLARSMMELNNFHHFDYCFINDNLSDTVECIGMLLDLRERHLEGQAMAKRFLEE